MFVALYVLAMSVYPSATLHTQLKMRLNYKRRCDGNIFDVRRRDAAAAGPPQSEEEGFGGDSLKENALEPKTSKCSRNGSRERTQDVKKRWGSAVGPQERDGSDERTIKTLNNTPTRILYLSSFLLDFNVTFIRHTAEWVAEGKQAGGGGRNGVDRLTCKMEAGCPVPRSWRPPPCSSPGSPRETRCCRAVW